MLFPACPVLGWAQSALGMELALPTILWTYSVLKLLQAMAGSVFGLERPPPGHLSEPVLTQRFVALVRQLSSGPSTSSPAKWG